MANNLRTKDFLTTALETALLSTDEQADGSHALNVNNRQLTAADDIVTAAATGDVISATLAMDTSALAAGDVACTATLAVTNALRAADTIGILQSVVVIDQDDQGTALDLIFFSSNTSLGTANGVPDIDDTESTTILGTVSILAADFIDLGANKVAEKRGLSLPIKSGTGVRTIWVSAICRSGTPTYTATGVKLRLGILW
jgi:hypothetical protein